MAHPTMSAVRLERFGGPQELELREVPRPEPLPTEVLVRVHGAGVNPVDWKVRAGSPMAANLGPLPVILGWDVSGVVEEVGYGVTTLRPGDEVFGMPWFPRAAGAYAEFVTAPSRQFARKPASIDHLHAGAVPLAALTAWQILVETARVQRGQRVLIHAAGGGVGHFAVQIARGFGAHVIGTARADRHLWLRDLGAEEMIDYTASDFDELVEDVDLVVDLVGDEQAKTSTRSLSVLKPGGLIVVVPSGASDELAHAAERLGVRTSRFLVEPDGPALRRIAELIDAGEVSVALERTFPLTAAADAHAYGERGRNRGKLVLEVGE